MTPNETNELPEIEITPQMIEAGLAVVWRSPIMDPTEEEMRAMTREVFSVMLRASRKSRYEHQKSS
jgi:hypothetical protein